MVQRVNVGRIAHEISRQLESILDESSEDSK